MAPARRRARGAAGASRRRKSFITRDGREHVRGFGEEGRETMLLSLSASERLQHLRETQPRSGRTPARAPTRRLPRHHPGLAQPAQGARAQPALYPADGARLSAPGASPTGRWPGTLRRTTTRWHQVERVGVLIHVEHQRREIHGASVAVADPVRELTTVHVVGEHYPTTAAGQAQT